MMLLVLGTVVIVPLLLPILLPELSVDTGALVWTLVRQLLLPMIAASLLAYLLPRLAERIQPWVANGGNIALQIVLVTTIIGYLPQMGGIIGSGALVLGSDPFGARTLSERGTRSASVSMKAWLRRSKRERRTFGRSTSAWSWSRMSACSPTRSRFTPNATAG